MNATQELNAPYVRNDALTASSVRRYCARKYKAVLAHVHVAAAILVAQEANDAEAGCKVADAIAAKVERIRERFQRQETVNDLRNNLAKARDKWIESPEGRRALEPSILREPCTTRYLQNRIEAAFIAGWNAKEKDCG